VNKQDNLHPNVVKDATSERVIVHILQAHREGSKVPDNPGRLFLSELPFVPPKRHLHTRTQVYECLLKTTQKHRSIKIERDV